MNTEDKDAIAEEKVSVGTRQDKKKCAIVIPVWKRYLSLEEFRSMIQCVNVLGGNEAYEMMLLCPERINEGYYTEIWSRYCTKDGKPVPLGILKADDRYFESRLSYSHLLSSKDFYRNFERFGYMLIYQLDAWVFSDELGKWCDMEYDLVGAPWCHLCRMDREEDCSQYVSSNFVGNGGLSLRKISSFVKHLPYDTFDDASYSDTLSEDVYISLIRHFLRPSCREASRFSVETNARRLIYEVNKGELPFGFHGLQVYDRELFDRLCNETFRRKDLEIFKNGNK